SFVPRSASVGDRVSSSVSMKARLLHRHGRERADADGACGRNASLAAVGMGAAALCGREPGSLPGPDLTGPTLRPFRAVLSGAGNLRREQRQKPTLALPRPRGLGGGAATAGERPRPEGTPGEIESV